MLAGDAKKVVQPQRDEEAAFVTKALKLGLIQDPQNSNSFDEKYMHIPAFLDNKKQGKKNNGNIDISRKSANARSGRFFCIVPFRFEFSPFSPPKPSSSSSSSEAPPISNNENDAETLEANTQDSDPKNVDVIGRLECLNTESPIMYIDFPTGCVKLSGRLVKTRNNFLTFKHRNNGIICEDQFDQVLLFSSYCWIGSKEENPQEMPLPMPSDIFVESTLMMIDRKGETLEKESNHLMSSLPSSPSSNHLSCSSQSSPIPSSQISSSSSSSSSLVVVPLHLSRNSTPRNSRSARRLSAKSVKYNEESSNQDSNDDKDDIFDDDKVDDDDVIEIIDEDEEENHLKRKSTPKKRKPLKSIKTPASSSSSKNKKGKTISDESSSITSIEDDDDDFQL